MIVLIGTFTFGYLFVIEKAHRHEVPDPTCPICQQIEKMVERIQHLRWYIPLLFIAITVLFCIHDSRFQINDKDILRLTPVSLKVLLLN